jgi:hypothetical protein
MEAMISPAVQKGRHSLSVIRIELRNDDFLIQRSAIKKLSPENRKKLKGMLTDVINSL